MIAWNSEKGDNSDNSKPRKCCAFCGKPITGPLWKRWCSDACKMKAYRARKRRRHEDIVTTNRNG